MASLLKNPIRSLGAKKKNIVAIAIANKLEKIINENLVRPLFRRAVATRRISGLSGTAKVLAEWLAYGIGGAAHSFADMNSPFQVLVAEVTNGVFAEIGYQINDLEKEKLLAEALPKIHEEVKRRISNKPDAEGIFSRIFGNEDQWNEVNDAITEYRRARKAGGK